jgi:membrane protein YdbS with pleckstrin-like domain
MTINISEEEKILRRIPVEIFILSFVVALASIFLFHPTTALFILAGGAFSALSFIWLKQSISRLLLFKNGDRHLKEEEPIPIFREPVPFFDKKKALRSALILYGIRLVLIIAIFFIIIFFFSRNIIAFVAGFSAIVPVFLAEAIVALSRMKQWKS